MEQGYHLLSDKSKLYEIMSRSTREIERYGYELLDMRDVCAGKGKCSSKDFPNECTIDSCVFCPHFIATKNVTNEFIQNLEKKNTEKIQRVKNRLKIQLSNTIDQMRVREMERNQKELAGLLNKQIIIESYKLRKDIQ